MSGGDTSEVWRAGPFVIKMGPAPNGQFKAEAAGLQALHRCGIRVPTVLHVEPGALVLSWLESTAPSPAALGSLIAQLHEAQGKQYGWDTPVFLGRFPIPESSSTGDWTQFWADQRILPLLRAAWTALGELGPRVESLLNHYTPPVEGPVLLHGDLWAGNVLHTVDGPALIDPSVWWGERGVDLAMMALFGGFDETCMSSYQEKRPIPREVNEALPFYQLYYLLLHVHHFGDSYLGGVTRVLRTYGE